MPRGGSAPNSGSVVVIDCRTGDILAMVSMPAYDPNSFSDGISQHRMADAVGGRPRAADQQGRCRGSIRRARRSSRWTRWRCSTPGSIRRRRVDCSGRDAGRHRRVPLPQAARPRRASIMKRAIAQSCDIYFYEMVARASAIDAIAPIARDAGPRRRSSTCRSPAQRYGTVPDSAWKLQQVQAGVDGRRHAQRVDRPGLCARQPAPAGGDGGADRVGPAADPAPARRARSAPTRRALPLPRRASRDRPRCDERRWSTAAAPAGAARLQVPGVDARRQDRHRAGPPDHHGRAAQRRAQQRASCRSSCATTACSSASRRSTTRATPPAIVIEHRPYRSATSTAAIGRDIMTYLFDRERALKSAGRARADAGAAISRTRMAARGGRLSRRPRAHAGRLAAKTDAAAPADAPAVEAATDRANHAAGSARRRRSDRQYRGRGRHDRAPE